MKPNQGPINLDGAVGMGPAGVVAAGLLKIGLAASLIATDL